MTSSLLRNTENGHSNRRVFDSASEDDPLLQEPLLLPTNVGFTLPDATNTSPLPEQAPPPPVESPSFGVFSKEKQESSRKKKRLVNYDSSSHIRVLFGMYGSVWGYVLPYCIFAVLITFLISYLQTHDIVDLTFASGTGHNFMAIMVSA